MYSPLFVGLASENFLHLLLYSPLSCRFASENFFVLKKFNIIIFIIMEPMRHGSQAHLDPDRQGFGWRGRPNAGTDRNCTRSRPE